MNKNGKKYQKRQISELQNNQITQTNEEHTSVKDIQNNKFIKQKRI